MTDFPRRLVDDDSAPPQIRNALTHVRADEPDMVRIERTLAAISGRPANGRGRVRVVLGSIGGVTSIATVAIAIAMLSRGSSDSPVPTVTPAPPTGESADIEPEEDRSSGRRLGGAVGGSASARLDNDIPLVSVTALPTVTTIAPTRGTETSSLARELELLRAARRKVTTGNATGALDDVARHDREFPEGVLTPEIEVTHIEALIVLGRTDEARGRSEAFLNRYPSSPQSARIRARLEAAP